MSITVAINELVLTIKPKNNKNNFEFEINASNHYNQNFNVKHLKINHIAII